MCDDLADIHIGKLIPAQPELTLVTIYDGGDDGIQITEELIIAWVLNEYTEPAIPITAGGHFPHHSDDEHFVLLRSAGGQLFAMGDRYETPTCLEQAVEIFRRQVKILKQKRAERAAARGHCLVDSVSLEKVDDDPAPP